MVLCIKVPLKQGEKIKKELMKKNLLNNDYDVKKDKEFIYYAVKKKYEADFSFCRKLLKKRKIVDDVKTGLSKKLKEDEFKRLRTSMDVIGTIAIIEIPDELKKQEKTIAKQMLESNNQIKTILKKGKHEGIFRTQTLTWLAGEKTKEAEYKENNVTLKLDVEKVYFSPRQSNERKRIFQQVKKGEEVLVMFSGCSPFTCTIAKNSEAKQVTGVEINPTGHNYALQNILSNKLNNTSVFLGDVRSIIPRLDRKYDRIIMPLPKTAEKFLDVALNASKKGTIIHLYNFRHEDNFKESTDAIKEACKKAKKKCRIIRTVKCGQHAPRTYRICVDFKIL